MIFLERGCGIPERKDTLTVGLSPNCFGDYYNRNGIDLARRELITFGFLTAQGGYEL